MLRRDELVQHLDALLDPERINDYGPNGLQVEGRDEIRKIATGVTASRNLIDAAIRDDADALIVHHGVLWNRDSARPITGWHGRRIRAIIDHNLNLIAYHLPLDLHADLGNNARLLAALGVRPDGRFGEHDIGFLGRFPQPTPIDALVARLGVALGQPPRHLEGGPATVRTVGVVSGAGQREFEAAIAAGCDVFVTGEANEAVTHLARETGTHYLWAGHHATEKGGVRALATHLADRFGVPARFLDDPNPV